MMTVLAFMQAGGFEAMIIQLLPIAAIFAIFYFLVIAPANKQRKKTAQMLEALKKGDRVVTAGGIHGTIQSVEKDVVFVRIGDNVKIKLQRSSVASVLTSDTDSE